MRITWFGGTTFRVYIGGKIIVTDVRGAEGRADLRELTAAADVVIGMDRDGDDVAPFDADNWRPSRPLRPIDGEGGAAEIFRLDGGGLFVDDADEGPLIIVSGRVAWGRFADDAAVVICRASREAAASAAAVMHAARPRLIGLASDGLSDADFAAIAAGAGRTAIQVLEPGLAVEA